MCVSLHFSSIPEAYHSIGENEHRIIKYRKVLYWHPKMSNIQENEIKTHRKINKDLIIWFVEYNNYPFKLLYIPVFTRVKKSEAERKKWSSNQIDGHSMETATHVMFSSPNRLWCCQFRTERARLNNPSVSQCVQFEFAVGNGYLIRINNTHTNTFINRYQHCMLLISERRESNLFDRFFFCCCCCNFFAGYTYNLSLHTPL